MGKACCSHTTNPGSILKPNTAKSEVIPKHKIKSEGGGNKNRISAEYSFNTDLSRQTQYILKMREK